MPRLVLFNKPMNVLSQFTDARSPSPRATLSDFIDLPGVYPAGRLDRDSEGLLLLTDDGKLQARIADPRHKMEKTYWAQVEGDPDKASLEAFQRGLSLEPENAACLDGLRDVQKARERTATAVGVAEGGWTV